MHIIPVIDLQAGQVVRASGGERQHYRPIDSALCGSAAPRPVAHRLCEHCATDTLYLADLDALQGRPPQATAIADLLHAQPHRLLWLDAGFADKAAADALLSRLGAAATRVRPVFGSESLRSLAAWRLVRDAWPQAVLSLDSRHGEPLDPARVWEAPALWPDHVIAMGLERVGSDAGPDVAHLARLRALAPERRWIGSGGIRHEADMTTAAATGAHAWLVASALHDGRIAPRPKAATECR